MVERVRDQFDFLFVCVEEAEIIVHKARHPGFGINLFDASVRSG